MPKRVDSNQKEIIAYLRAKGCSVLDLHEVGKGVPDLLVGYKGFNILAEIKSRKGKLNKIQEKWQGEWKGTYFILRTIGDVTQMLLNFDSLNCTLFRIGGPAR